MLYFCGVFTVEEMESQVHQA